MQVIAAKTRLVDVPARWERRALYPDDEAWLRQEPDGRVTVQVHRRPRPFAMFRAPRLERLGDLARDLADTVAPLIDRDQRLRVRIVDVAPIFQRPKGEPPEIWISVWARRDPQAAAQQAAPGLLAARGPELRQHEAKAPSNCSRR